MRNARNTLFLVLRKEMLVGLTHVQAIFRPMWESDFDTSTTLALLLGETHVALTSLCGIHFQCVVPHGFHPIRVCARESVRKSVSIALFLIYGYLYEEECVDLNI